MILHPEGEISWLVSITLEREIKMLHEAHDSGRRPIFKGNNPSSTRPGLVPYQEPLGSRDQQLDVHP